MPELSIIIPSRVDQYLQRTVDDLLEKAEGKIEIIIILDGYYPDPIIKDHPNVILLHQGEVHENFGMRAAINAGVRIARGKYLMKIDEHCMMDKGYDTKLKADCEDNWVVIPRRKRLDAENWTLIKDGRPDIDYMAIEYPYLKPLDKTQGLHGAEWKRPERTELIDDTPSMQGSCYFMTRKHWDKEIKELDSDKYGTFTMEAQEIGMKTWLSGGRVVVNKKTNYAHFHKGRRGKGYGFSTAQYRKHTEGMERSRLYAIDYWLNTKDFKHDWNWFVAEKFPDMPGWSADWCERVEKDKLKDYSTLRYKDDFWLAGLREKDV